MALAVYGYGGLFIPFGRVENGAGSSTVGIELLAIEVEAAANDFWDVLCCGCAIAFFPIRVVEL